MSESNNVTEKILERLFDDSLSNYNEAEDKFVEASIDKAIYILKNLKNLKDRNRVNEWLEELNTVNYSINYYTRTRAEQYSINNVYCGDPDNELAGIDVEMISYRELENITRYKKVPSTVDPHNFYYAYRQENSEFFAIYLGETGGIASPSFKNVYDCFRWIRDVYHKHNKSQLPEQESESLPTA